jgi:hypothetical protein
MNLREYIYLLFITLSELLKLLTALATAGALVYANFCRTYIPVDTLVETFHEIHMRTSFVINNIFILLS